MNLVEVIFSLRYEIFLVSGLGLLLLSFYSLICFMRSAQPQNIEIEEFPRPKGKTGMTVSSKNEKSVFSSPQKFFDQFDSSSLTLQPVDEDSLNEDQLVLRSFEQSDEEDDEEQNSTQLAEAMDEEASAASKIIKES